MAMDGSSFFVVAHTVCTISNDDSDAISPHDAVPRLHLLLTDTILTL